MDLRCRRCRSLLGHWQVQWPSSRVIVQPACCGEGQHAERTSQEASPELSTHGWFQGACLLGHSSTTTPERTDWFVHQPSAGGARQMYIRLLGQDALHDWRQLGFWCLCECFQCSNVVGGRVAVAHQGLLGAGVGNCPAVGALWRGLAYAYHEQVAVVPGLG